MLLHGLGADGTSWTLQLPALADAGFRPLAPDAPGFGGSRYNGRGWSIRRAAAQMAGLLGELGTGPVHVVGLSMGGVIAQQFALDFPQLTRKLVLVSTFSALRPETLGGWGYFAQRAGVVLFLGLEAQARLVSRRLFPDPKDEPLREMFISGEPCFRWDGSILENGLGISRRPPWWSPAQTILLSLPPASGF